VVEDRRKHRFAFHGRYSKNQYRVNAWASVLRMGRKLNIMVACSRNFCLVLALAVFTASLTACTLRLYAPVPPSEEQVKVVAKNPHRYVLHIEERVSTVAKSERNDAPGIHVTHAANYEIPKNGLLSIRVPSYRPYCGVYLFNFIKVGGGGDDALKFWQVSVQSEVRPVRVLSLKQVRNLPTDSDGYHLLKIPD